MERRTCVAVIAVVSFVLFCGSTGGAGQQAGSSPSAPWRFEAGG
jgi:hypothetical protein